MKKKRKRLVRPLESYEQVTDDKTPKEFKPNLPIDTPAFQGELHQDDQKGRPSTSLHTLARKRKKIGANRRRDVEDEVEGEETVKPKKENNAEDNLID